MTNPKGSMMRRSAIATCSPYPDEKHLVFFQDNFGDIRQILFDGNDYSGGNLGAKIASDAKWHTPLAAVYTGDGNSNKNSFTAVLLYLDNGNIIQAVETTEQGAYPAYGFNSLAVAAAPFSNLAAVFYPTDIIVRVFYQDASNMLRVHEWGPNTGSVSATGVGQPPYSKDGGNIGPALRESGIAACFHDTVKETSVFYQDTNAAVRQFISKDNGKTWVSGSLNATALPIQCAIGAVAHSGLYWKQDVIGVYMIDHNGRLVSWAHMPSSGWNSFPRYLHTENSLHNGNVAVIVFPRNGMEEYRVFYQGESNELLNYGLAAMKWGALGTLPTID